MLPDDGLERFVPLLEFPANGFRLVDRGDGSGVWRERGGRNLKMRDSHPGGQFGGLAQQPQRGVGVGPAAVGALVPLLAQRVQFVANHSRHGANETAVRQERSEEPTSELQSLMRISYAVFCLKKK